MNEKFERVLSPAVLVTAYRPDVDRWTGDFGKTEWG